MGNSKEPIKLRRRKTKSGNTSLYLDIYLNGERTYEYLKLYLTPERTRADKDKNRETLQLAEAIKSKRIVELRNGEFGFKNGFATETLFFDYYKSLCEKRLGEESRGNWGNWYSCLHHLRIYEKREKITFADITPEWVQGFKDYLENRAVAWAHDKRHREKEHLLSRNSKVSYFNKLRACLNQAFDDRIIAVNPCRGIDGFKAEEGTRMYLTLEELKKLVNTPCDYDGVRRAFLFSCLTGLRRSDILRLKWGDVFRQGDFTRIIFRQKKTKGQEYLDITEQAADIMGERGKNEDYIFTDVFTPDCTNKTIQNWVLRAGIDKKITFHCFRHTYATLQLAAGTDLYTISKMLTHSNVGTTQVYADVVNDLKRKASEQITLK